jgi:hypothetical protein
MKKRFLSNWAILLSSVLVFFIVPFFVNSGTAYAVDYVQPGKEVLLEGEWIDRAHIKITKFEFTDDSKLSDEAKREGRATINTRLGTDVVGKEWSADNISADEGDSGSFFLDTGCGNRSKIYTFQEDREANGKIIGNTVRIHDNDLRIKGTNQNCVKVIGKLDRDLTPVDEDRILEFYPNNFDNANVWYQQKAGASGTLERVDHNSDEEVKQDSVDKLVYNRDGPRDCKITVKFIASPANGDRNVADYKSCAGTANEVKAIFVKITNIDEVNAPPDDSVTPGNQPDLDCEARLLNPLTWLMCPLIEGANLAVQTLDNAITAQLTFDTTGQDSLLNEQSASGKALFNTWASFRYISLGILVIIGLVMIISQALSFGIFDAYTIKKVLPKLLIGVIGISVSWYLCKFAIEIFNDLGVGVRSLLYGPFKNLGGVRVDQRIVSMLGVAAGGAIIGLGVIGILSFVVTALMAVIIAFGILVFRRILIILLVVTAPVAIACWILPNTEKVWKMWWDFFSRALVVFPIIALFIAGGRVIAQVATTAPAGQSPGLLESTIAFIAYFGPYFALPAAFRLAGGAIATLGGVANDRSKGVFDRLKKGRQERMSDRFKRATNEKLYNPNNAALQKWTGTKVGKVLNPNKLASWGVAPVKNAQYATKGLKIPGLSAAGRRLESGIHGSVMEQSEKWLQHVNKHGANDKFYRAVGGMYKGFNDDTKKQLIKSGLATADKKADGSYDLSSIRATKSLSSEKDFHDMAHILEGSSSDSERKAAEALHANAAYTAGLYGQEDMNYASTAVGGAMGLAAHGFFAPDDAADAGNLIQTESGGSTDFAHAAVVAAEAIGASKNPDVKPGYGHAIEEYTDAKGKKQKRFISGSKSSDRSWGALETFAQGDFAQTKSGFYDEKRTGGKIKELITATRGDAASASAVKAKWQKELTDQGASLPEAARAIKKRLAQAPAVIGELQQVTSAYSQAPIDSRAKAQQILDEFKIPPLGAFDPDAARGGAPGGGGGGNNPLGGGPDLGGPDLGGGPKLN